MDTGILQGIGTLVVMAAFIGLCVWAYSKRRKRDFEEAANLPFADEEPERRPPDEPPDRERNSG